MLATLVLALATTACSGTKEETASTSSMDAEATATTEVGADTTEATAPAATDPSTSVATTSPPTTAPPAPTTEGPSGVVPTSVNPWGATCADIVVTEGMVVDPRVAEIGGICIKGSDDVSQVYLQICDDGRTLYWATGLAWWYSGKPAHLGDVPDDEKQGCSPGMISP